MVTNVVLVLADDLGCSDIGCHGGEMYTLKSHLVTLVLSKEARGDTFQ